VAIGDSYATAAEYRARINKADIADDTTIGEQLKAVSHYIDQRCRRKDGFNQSASVEARLFDGNGKARVWLRDSGGVAHDIATTTGLIVKCDLNGDYDVADSGETLTINTHFWVYPDNAAVGSDPRPYQALELVPTNSVTTFWPLQRRAIEVTAKFGFPEVPEAIKELTCALTRYLRDINESGVTFAIQAIDTAVQESREMSFYLRNIERAYARPPSF
jgi:hypothetical protein